MKGKKFINVFAVLLMLFSLVTSPISALAEGTTDNSDLEISPVDESVEVQTEEAMLDEVKPEETTEGLHQELSGEAVQEGDSKQQLQEEVVPDERAPEIDAVYLNFGGSYFNMSRQEGNVFSFSGIEFSEGGYIADTPLEDDNSLVHEIQVISSPYVDVEKLTYSYNGHAGEVLVEGNVASIPLKEILGIDNELTLGQLKEYLTANGDIQIDFQLTAVTGMTTDVSFKFVDTLLISNPDAYQDYWVYINRNNTTHNLIEINIDADGPLETIDVYLEGEFIENIPGDTVNYVFNELESDREYEIKLIGNFEGNVKREAYNYIQTKLDPSLLNEVKITIQKENADSSFGYKIVNTTDGEVMSAGDVREDGTLYNYDEEFLQLPEGTYELIVYDWGDYSRSNTYTLEVVDGQDNTFTFELNESELISQPLNTQITNVTKDSINLSWSSKADIEGYYLSIWSEDHGVTDEVYLDKDASSYQFSNLTEDTLYEVNLYVKYNDWLEESKFLKVRTSSENEGEVITFNEPSLEEAIKKEVGIYNGEITTNAIKDLYHLDVSYSDISDLSGLEHATNLEDLYLQDNNIGDISPLSNLKKLRSLWLGSNPISNIEALSKLTSLSDLNLDSMDLEDITPLDNLKELTDLHLSSNNIKDISVLADLSKLRYIDLGWNNITDISPLTNLTNLEMLWLNGNDIQDLESVVSLMEAGVEIYFDGLFEGDLFLDLGKVDDSTATVNWFINRDVEEIDYIEVYLDDRLVESLDGEATSYTITNLDPTSYYYLEVRAYYVNGDYNTVYAEIETDYPADAKAVTQIKIKDFNKDTGITYFDMNYRAGEWYHYEDGTVDEEGYLINEDGSRSFEVPVGLYDITFSDANYDHIDSNWVRIESGIDYHENPIIIDFNRTGELVDIEDSELEKYLRDYFGIYDRPLTTIDMEELVNFDYYGNGLESLVGLEHAINLDGVTLRNSEIDNEDLTTLAKVKTVTHLDLSMNNISDISQLKNLTNIRHLDLERNNIQDISVLSELNKLQYLYLSDNPITDISVLTSLTNLKEVYLSNLELDFESDEVKSVIDTLEKNGVYVSYEDKTWIHIETKEKTDSSISFKWWMNNSESVEQYHVEIFNYHGHFEEVLIDADSTSQEYTFDDLDANTFYNIRVHAMDANNEEIASYWLEEFTDVPDLEKKDTTLRILNKEGKAIPSGLEFSIEGTGTNNSHVYLYGVTDKDGYLTNWESKGQTVELPIGTYEVMVFAEGNYQTTIKEIAVSENGENTFDITLPYLEKQTKTIEVSIVDEEGNPVTSVEYLSLYSQGAVQDFGYDAGERNYWDINSKDGLYVIEDIAVSDNYQYQLNIRADGYITHNQVVQLNEKTNGIEVVLGKGLTITGKVEDANGNSINANYSINGKNTYAYGELNGQEMKVEGLNLEDLTVEISFPGYQTEVVKVSLDQFVDKSFDLGTITLQSEKYVHGKVVDSDGKPVKEAYINLTRKGASSYWGNYWTRTDSNGYFKINNVQDGTYKLTTEAYKLPNGELNDVVPSFDEYTIVLEEQGEGSFAGAGNGLTASKKTVVPGKSLDYQFNYTNNGDATAENVTVTLNIPESLTIEKKSVLLNGEKVTLNENGITIPSVEAGESGVISFKANVNNDASESIITTANITHGDNVNTYSSTANVLFVSLNAPAVTASQSVKVYGDAKPGTTVQIYDGDLLLAEISEERKSKWWYADIVLPSKEGENSTHQLVAKVLEKDVDGNILDSYYSDPVSVSYQPDTPEVTDVTISAGWNQNIKINPNVGVVTSAIVEYTPIDIRVAFDKNVETASIGFLGETYKLTKDGKEYVTTIPGTWSSYGEQMIDLQFTFDGQEIKVPLMEVIVLIDPSGFVFEGSMDNRLPGVTAVVEQLNEDTNQWRLWDAENYGQINPQITDEDGRYGWDVLAGKWRVIWTKEGYETYISRTVVVPPAETQLNVPMIRTSAPEVISITPTDNKADVTLDSEIIIEFDRLMNEKDIEKNIQIVKDGQAVEGSFTLEGMNGYKETGENTGYFVEDTTKKLSQTVVWEPTDGFDYDATYTVVVSKEIQDYDGKTLEAAVEQSFTTVSAPEEPTEPGEETTDPEVEEPTEPGEETTDPEEEPTEPGEETTDPEDEEPTEPGDGTTDSEEEEPTEPGDGTTDSEEEKPTESGEEPTDPEAEKPSESNNDTTSEPKDNQSDKQNEEKADEKQKDGKELPDTSTNMFTWLLFGLTLVVIGGAVFFIQRRRNA